MFVVSAPFFLRHVRESDHERGVARWTMDKGDSSPHLFTNM